MSREELDRIQTKLKVAIQSHQIIVAKLKSDTQNEEYREKLHSLQSNITTLSDQQRVIVQILRQELISKNLTVDPLHSPTSLPLPAHQQSRVPPLAHTGSHLTVQCPLSPVCGNLTSHTRPADLSLKSPHNPGDVETNVATPLLCPAPRLTSTWLSKIKPVTPSHPVLLPVKSEQSTIASSDKENDEQSKVPVNKPLTARDKKKMDFMASVDLISKESLKDLQGKRSVHKRRASFSTQMYCSGEPRKKRIVYLMSPKRDDDNGSRPKGRSQKVPSTARNNVNDKADETSAVCQLSTTLCAFITCCTCRQHFHKDCLSSPPSSDLETSMWTCKDCQSRKKMESQRQENMAIVHAYIASKVTREEEKKRLQKRGAELRNEKTTLERRSHELRDCLNKQAQERQELLTLNKNIEETVKNLKNFVHIFQT